MSRFIKHFVNPGKLFVYERTAVACYFVFLYYLIYAMFKSLGAHQPEISKAKSYINNISLLLQLMASILPFFFNCQFSHKSKFIGLQFKAVFTVAILIHDFKDIKTIISSSYFRTFTIVVSLFRYFYFTVHRIFALPYFHHHSIVFSPSFTNTF